MEGIGSGQHTCDAIAPEDSGVREDIRHLLHGIGVRGPIRSKVARVDVAYDLRGLVRLLGELGVVAR
jgi:hypothetical protein